MNPITQISNILKVYEDFSKISGLKNNSSKTVYGFIADRNRLDIKNITSQLTMNWGAKDENFKFKGDSLSFLGDTLMLGVDENRYMPDLTLTTNDSLIKRFGKINKTIDSWYSKDYYFPTVFARSLASKNYLSSQILHLFPNTLLDEDSLKDTQKSIDRYVNKKVLMPRDNTYLSFHGGGTSTPNR